jgi:hypothetical protein
VNNSRDLVPGGLGQRTGDHPSADNEHKRDEQDDFAQDHTQATLSAGVVSLPWRGRAAAPDEHGK